MQEFPDRSAVYAETLLATNFFDRCLKERQINNDRDQRNQDCREQSSHGEDLL
jgi:hypothetical protein